MPAPRQHGFLRDWGHAKDYVKMQWMMLQQEQPEDFVIATGVQYSVRQFVEMAAAQLGIKLRFEGTGVEEKGIVVSVTGHDAPGVKPGDVIVQVDPRYFRPAEVETLLGDPTKAHEKLGWKPETTLQEMVSEMVAKDLEAAKNTPCSSLMATRLPSRWSPENDKTTYFCRRSSRNGGFRDCSPAGTAR